MEPSFQRRQDGSVDFTAVGLTIKTDLEILTENFGWVLITYIGYSVSVKVEMNFELILETAKEIERMQNILLLVLVMKSTKYVLGVGGYGGNAGGLTSS